MLSVEHRHLFWVTLPSDITHVAKSLVYFQQSAATSYPISSRSVAMAILHKKHYYIAKWPSANIPEWFTHQLKGYKST